MQPTRFSILLPVYNGMPLLQPCMQSLLAQTYPHWEIWVADSGCTDGSLDYIRSLHDSRIKLLPAAGRLSITENWARFLTLDLQPYATIMGQDDVWDHRFLEAMAQSIAAHPMASVHTAHFHFINAAGQMIRPCKPMGTWYDGADALQAMLSRQMDMMATGYVFSTAAYRQAGGIPLFPNLLYSDYALWWQLARTGGLVVHPGQLFSFRLHTNTSQTTSGLLYLQALEAFTQFLHQAIVPGTDEHAVWQAHFGGFVAHYGQMITHRILAAPLAQRQQVMVPDAIHRLNTCIASSGSSQQVQQLNRSIALANTIDRHGWLRSLFWQWKAWQRP